MSAVSGYIVYNGFWNASALPDPVQRLAAAGMKRGVPLTPIANTLLTAEYHHGVTVNDWSKADYALFWDKDIRLARAMETCSVRLYNTADGVAVCDDKAATHLALAAQHIPMPHTLLAPMTYIKMDEQADVFLRLAADKLGFPMVVKECFGSLGGQVYLAHDDVELRRLTREMAARPFIVQQFVAASAGQDVRLYVVGNRVVASMRRRSDTDFRANIGNGGQAEAYTPSDEEIAFALESCRILGLYFAGVDLLHDADGRPLVCEVNSNAHMSAITACTGVDVAGAIVDFVLEQERQQ